MIDKQEIEDVKDAIAGIGAVFATAIFIFGFTAVCAWAGVPGASNLVCGILKLCEAAR